MATETKRQNQQSFEATPKQEATNTQSWQFLMARPHPWRQQLWIKGRRLPAATVWTDWRVNGGTMAEIAENWELPIAAVEESIRYGESHQDLLRMEAEEEQRRMAEAGVSVLPRNAR